MEIRISRVQAGDIRFLPDREAKKDHSVEEVG